MCPGSGVTRCEGSWIPALRSSPQASVHGFFCRAVAAAAGVLAKTIPLKLFSCLGGRGVFQPSKEGLLKHPVPHLCKKNIEKANAHRGIPNAALHSKKKKNKKKKKKKRKWKKKRRDKPRPIDRFQKYILDLPSSAAFLIV